MDAKQRALIADLHRRVKERTFHERDVLGLLILLREHAAEASPVRELSDFIAHREKDRGALKEYVHHVVAYGEAMIAGTAATLKIDVVHTASAFRASLNATISTTGLAEFDAGESNDVLACVMSLLQGVRLFHKKGSIGHFALTRTTKVLQLNGVVQMPGPKAVSVVFPALSVPNAYCSLANAGKVGEFPGLVEARCSKGRSVVRSPGKRAEAHSPLESGRT